MPNKLLGKAGMEVRRGVWARATDSSKVTRMFEMRPGGVQRNKRKGQKGSQEDRHEAEGSTREAEKKQGEKEKSQLSWHGFQE